MFTSTIQRRPKKDQGTAKLCPPVSSSLLFSLPSKTLTIHYSSGFCHPIPAQPPRSLCYIFVVAASAELQLQRHTQAQKRGEKELLKRCIVVCSNRHTHRQSDDQASSCADVSLAFGGRRRVRLCQLCHFHCLWLYCHPGLSFFLSFHWGNFSLLLSFSFTRLHSLQSAVSRVQGTSCEESQQVL